MLTLLLSNSDSVEASPSLCPHLSTALGFLALMVACSRGRLICEGEDIFHVSCLSIGWSEPLLHPLRPVLVEGELVVVEDGTHVVSVTHRIVI